MNAHAEPRPRHSRSSWFLPLLLGVAFGLYAAWLDSNNEPADSGRTALIGVVSGAVTTVVCYVLGRVQAALVRELRAAAYGIVFGCALGYLLSLSGWTVLKSSVAGLVLGLSMAAVSFYHFHTREDRDDDGENTAARTAVRRPRSWPTDVSSR